MDINKTIENFLSKGYKVKHFRTGAEASVYLQKEIFGMNGPAKSDSSDGSRPFSVGIGGSKTIEKLGLYDLLKNDCRVFWHWRNIDSDTFDRAGNADVYLCSANAVSEAGEIVNIDGRCNRVAHSVFGHRQVIYIVGTNKIEENLERAVWRARNIAAPLNARRLSCKTPCVLQEPMKCHDCKSPERICRNLSIMLEPSMDIDLTEIIFIDEELGF